jgi:hypothetical protein
MERAEMSEVLDLVTYRDWHFHLGEDGERNYLQVWFPAQDVLTGKSEWEHGRKWMLSLHMTKSELVQTALKAVLTAEEHEAREHFTYKSKRIFGPHLDVDRLLDICNDTDTR